MANRENGEVDLPAGDKVYTLHFGAAAICAAEDLLDMGINAISRRIQDKDDFRLSNWRALLWAALQDNHKGIDLAGAAVIMDEAGYDVAIQAVGEAIAAGQPEAAPKNPPKASRKNPTGK